MKKVLGVIPARFGSSRFPGKPLALIKGKPLLQWVIEGSLTSKQIDDLIVATDDPRIFELAESLDVKAVMTDPSLPSGTDRVWAAIKDLSFDIAVNIQGDEPLIHGNILDELVLGLKNHNASMATLCTHFRDSDDIDNPNIVKVLVDRLNFAIYFSRFPIPYSRNKDLKTHSVSFSHIGIYAYKKAFLKLFCESEPSLIEKSESLEQLRALDLGAAIYVVKTEYQTRGVDTPEDVIFIEKHLSR